MTAVCGRHTKLFSDATHCLFNGHLDNPSFRNIAIQKIIAIVDSTVTLSKSGTLNIRRKGDSEFVALEYTDIFGKQKTTGHPFKDKCTELPNPSLHRTAALNNQFNYMEANLGLSRGDAECLLFKNTRDGMRELLDILRDEYRDIYGQMQELISKSEELLYVLECDKDVSEKKWWLDQRTQLAEAIDNAKKEQGT